MQSQANIEHLHDDVFGASFSLYDKAQMEEFIRPFQIRFERNKIDAEALFKGKKCLDAGCGNGRGSLFMAMNGAEKIHSLDVSPLNIESTKRNAKLFGFSEKIEPQLSSLENIPFADETFDFVWCNGVIMHTHNPDKCLQELARVLKVNGKAWIYVYGSGGVYWYCVYKFRELLKGHTERECMDVLTFMQTPTSFLAEYMDDWKAPYLRTYTHEDLSTRLQSLGFENTNLLPYGTDYDTSHRVTMYPEDKVFLGEGDLRYLLTKTQPKKDIAKPISDSEHGSDYAYQSVFTKPIDEKFAQITPKIEKSLAHKLLTFAYLQRNLRDQIFSNLSPFEMTKYLAYFDQTINFLEKA